MNLFNSFMTPKTYLRIVLCGILFYILYFLLGILLSIFFTGHIGNIDRLLDIYQLSDFIIYIITPLFFSILFFKGLFLLKKHPDYRTQIFFGVATSIIALLLILVWLLRVNTFPIHLETVGEINIPYFYRFTP